MSTRAGAAQYRQNHLEGIVMNASPHKLVALLLTGATDRIRLAEACLNHSDLSRKGKAIGEACAIVGHLNGSLDHSAGGEMAQGLSALYDYIVIKLTEANLNNDLAALHECLDLLTEIQTAWNAIPEDLHHATSHSE